MPTTADKTGTRGSHKVLLSSSRPPNARDEEQKKTEAKKRSSESKNFKQSGSCETFCVGLQPIRFYDCSSSSALHSTGDSFQK